MEKRREGDLLDLCNSAWRPGSPQVMEGPRRDPKTRPLKESDR